MRVIHNVRYCFHLIARGTHSFLAMRWNSIFSPVNTTKIKDLNGWNRLYSPPIIINVSKLKASRRPINRLLCIGNGDMIRVSFTRLNSTEQRGRVGDWGADVICVDLLIDVGAIAWAAAVVLDDSSSSGMLWPKLSWPCKFKQNYNHLKIDWILLKDKKVVESLLLVRFAIKIVIPKNSNVFFEAFNRQWVVNGVFFVHLIAISISSVHFLNLFIFTRRNQRVRTIAPSFILFLFCCLAKFD